MSAGLSLYLDLVRLAAALTVVVYHSGSVHAGGGWMRMPGFGPDAVFAFFVLSGLVIAYTTPSHHPTAADYFATRVARLWSVLLPALVMTGILDAIGIAIAPHVYEGWAWAAWDHPVWRLLCAAFFLNEIWFFSIAPLSNIPVWSLGFEFWYYVLFGIWVYASAVMRTPLLLLTAFFMGPKLLLFFPTWLLGVGIWRYRQRWKLPPPLAIAVVLVAPTLIVAAHATHLPAHLFQLETRWLSASITDSKYGAFLWPLLLSMIVAANFIAAMSITDRLYLLFAPCERPIQYFAGFTLSIYLLHMPLLLLFSALMDHAPIGFWRSAATVMSALIGCLLFGMVFESQRRPLRRILLRAAALIDPSYSQNSLVHSKQKGRGHVRARN
jgi:peptidoglycan/LPS O-acetylase OafA/YrhL